MTRPSCISTQPNPVLEVSQKTPNGFSMLGYAKTGAVVSKWRKALKVTSHSRDHTNFTSFCSSLVIGLAILEKSRIK